MCHWTLRVASFHYHIKIESTNTTQWQCGDSFFTKHSSCSFDRAVLPNNPLNPLHPSITPLKQDESPGSLKSVEPKLSTAGSSRAMGDARRMTEQRYNSSPEDNAKWQSRGNKPEIPRTALATIGDGAPKYYQAAGTNGVKTVRLSVPRNGSSMVPQPETGKSPQFGDQSFVESTRCQVFEVVLQQYEATICPSCARSPRRAALPAHARGCFGLS